MDLVPGASAEIDGTVRFIVPDLAEFLARAVTKGQG